MRVSGAARADDLRNPRRSDFELSGFVKNFCLAWALASKKKMDFLAPTPPSEVRFEVSACLNF
jgi:hypothetical protein